MRRIMMTLAGTAVVLGGALVASANEAAPPAQAPAQAPMQAPKQAPMQAPTPKQAPAQAPVQKNVQAPTQSPIQKGGKPMAYEASPSDQYVAMGRPGLFRRFR